MTSPLLPLLLGLVLAAWLLEQLLVSLQQASIRRGAKAVPPAFAAVISLEEHHKAARYSRAKLRLKRLALSLSLALSLVMFLGGMEWLSLHLGTWESTWLRVLVFFFAYSLIQLVLDLPLEIVASFGIEKRFGFHNSTVALFIRDQLTGYVLVLVLGGVLLSLVVALTEHWQQWWLALWLCWMGLQLLLLWLFPQVIAPLFNRFTPLEAGSLKTGIEKLLAATGFQAATILVMDGSRRSNHGNAYFTGLGSSKRVVLFDTLIKQLDEKEILAVLAHELGHARHRDLLRQILVSAGLSALVLYGLQWFYHYQLSHGIGLEHTLLSLMLVLPALGLVIAPLTHGFSRSREFAADAFAVRQQLGEFLASGLVKLYKNSASSLTPSRWYSLFHDSHPPAALRLARLNSHS